MITRDHLELFAGHSHPNSNLLDSDAGFDMVAYLSKHGFEVIERKEWASQPGGHIYQLARCPFNPEHVNGSAAFTTVNGKPGFTCKHDGCAGKNIKDVFAVFPPAARKEKKSQAQLLVELAAGAELFHTPDGEAYARVPLGCHQEIWKVRGQGFRGWLVREFYLKQGKPPGNQAMQDALGVLDAKAQFDGPTVRVFTRVAGDDERIYIDLANEKWEAVEITPAGWRIVTDPPIRFRRTRRGMQALPYPELGGSIGLLRKYVNLAEADNNVAWVLLLAWLAAACRPRGPYPILVLQGPQGSAKSTTARILRRLVDPFSAPLRTVPRDERDLQSAAKNSWIVGLDNVSGIPNWLSDALCRLATGGGLGTRELYSDDEETIFDATRPIILNGIDHLCERPDLADRSLVINLPPIDEDHRKEEEVFYRDFEADLPKIFGALLDAVAVALCRLPEIKLSKMPRMADFAKFGAAVEIGFDFEPGTFQKAYAGNRTDGIDATFESDAFAAALREFIEGLGSDVSPWTGIADDLRKQIDSRVADDGTKKSPAWPKTAKAVSNSLRRLATTLREVGIVVTFAGKRAGGRREIIITRISVSSTATMASTATSQAQPKEPQRHSQQESSGGTDGGVPQTNASDGGPPPGAGDLNPRDTIMEDVTESDSGDSGDVLHALSEVPATEEGWV